MYIFLFLVSLIYLYSITVNFHFILSYGKTKDVFGWPEETEEVPSSSGNTTQTATTTNVDSENSSQHQPVTSLDK
jgi:hypothetical protein